MRRTNPFNKDTAVVIDTSTLEDFRLETRSWIETNYPEALKAPVGADELVSGGTKQKFFHPDAKMWLDRMADKGWTCPEWPKEYGGAGLAESELTVLREELAHQNCRPPLLGMGRFMLGPTLMQFGMHEQKLEHLPKIARGEIRWCQGYSEPNSGSDLASLQMRAVDHGDYYLVSGTKVWTSNANEADWMFCLVRTDTKVKHGGISLVLFDRTDPAVTISPIKLISGYSVFYETAIADLTVLKTNLVGKENEGWEIAKFLLNHERVMISALGGPKSQLKSVAEIAKTYIGIENGRVADPVIRDHVAQQDMDDQAFGLTAERFREMAKQGTNPGAASSMLKHVGTKFAKNKFELLISIEGNQSLGWEGEGFNQGELDLARAWLRSKGYSIEGGTSEIQLNIIATRVLNLPKS